MIFYRKIRNRYNESPVLKRIADNITQMIPPVALK